MASCRRYPQTAGLTPKIGRGWRAGERVSCVPRGHEHVTPRALKPTAWGQAVPPFIMHLTFFAA